MADEYRPGDRKVHFDVDGSSLELKFLYGNPDSLQGRTNTNMKVRRVVTDRDGEHVQISLEVGTFKGKRTLTQYGHMTLTPADVEVLKRALTTVVPQSGTEGRPNVMLDYAGNRAFMCDLYGITDPNENMRRLVAERRTAKAGA